MSVDVVYPALSSSKKKIDLHSFSYGGELIKYELKERKSDINRLLIKVHPDCHVVVLAPKNTSVDDVRVAVKKRSRWIHNHLIQFKSQLKYVRPRNYVGGESHHYLGKKYLLKVINSKNEIPVKTQIKLLRGKLEIAVSGEGSNKNNVNQIVRMSLDHWYKLRAKEVFSRRLNVLIGQTHWVLEKPPVRIQAMKNQWGSCSPNGRLTLNTHLVKAPRECIDYVILHELCHLAEHNHSPRFYRLMSEVMPEWEEVKERLDGMAEVLLNGNK